MPQVYKSDALIDSKLRLDFDYKKALGSPTGYFIYDCPLILDRAIGLAISSVVMVCDLKGCPIHQPTGG